MTEESQPKIRKNGDETIVDFEDDLPVGIAIRTSSNAQTGEKRMLITVRAGAGSEKIVFNFGTPGGPTTQGGDPGSPPCP